MNSGMVGGVGVQQRKLTRESRICTYFNYSGMTADPLRYATSLLVIYRSNITLVARKSFFTLQNPLSSRHSFLFSLNLSVFNL